MNSNNLVNFVSDEEGILNVEVIQDLNNWDWLTFVLSQGTKVEVESVQEAVDFWTKNNEHRAIEDEEDFKERCQEFFDAVQSKVDEQGGPDFCAITFVNWSVERDTNLACAICKV